MNKLPATEDNIILAANIIKNGGIVIFPTDTVYGIGCDLNNIDAVEKIYNIKGRPATMPLIAMIDQIDKCDLLTSDLPSTVKDLMHKWWPGALTIIINANRNISQRVLAGGNTIGIRIPAHTIALSLLHHTGLPLATTSANRSGMPSPCSAEDAIKSLLASGNIDIVLDAGLASGGIPSTLLDCTKNPPAILRQGDITADMLNL